MTFPGTVASLRQMWGRAGRRGRGLAVYVAGEDALDQFFCRHPDEFLDRPVEAAILDHENEQIHAAHMLCAAHEGPLDGDDDATLGPGWRRTAEVLVSSGDLRRAPERLVRAAPHRTSSRPPPCRCARAGRDNVAIVDTDSGELLGTVETARAHTTTPRGRDLPARRALVRGRGAGPREPPRAGAPVRRATGTRSPRSETDTHIERLLDRRECMGVTLSFGTVVVTEQVLAYQKKRLADHEAIDLIALDLPQTSFMTQALWYEVGPDVISPELPLFELLGALHAAEHTQIAVLPLLAMCDRWDIGGLSTNLHPQTGGPTIFIYDGHPGGIGITRRGYLAFEALVDDAHRLISECPCEKGCPSCVQSPKCGNLNDMLSKLGATQLMGRMLAA